ncbi:MAG: DUF4422 domain-containing protein [Synergistaceae bacterium]|nr:DUF4422 domain-containing protein [Synergistaceae bacterium]
MADNNATIEVYVATHKKVDFEFPDYCSTIQVNAEKNGQWEGYLHDNDNQDNISLKNPNYCELTALYSMWKNCKADIQGLFHYRRVISKVDHMKNKYEWQLLIDEHEVKDMSISEQTIRRELENYDIILTFPETYASVSVLEAFRYHCYWKDLEKLYKIFAIDYPEYNQAFLNVLNAEHFSRCNMFIARREFVSDYCSWLFEVLGKFESQISLEGYDLDHSRIYGYVAEFLLNVYVLKHNLKYKYYYRARTFVENVYKARFKRILKQVPGLLTSVKVSSKIINNLLTRRQTEENGEFIITRELPHGDSVFIALVTPKGKNFSLEALYETFRKLEAEAEERNLLFRPRINFAQDTPDSIKESLREAGIRIMNT